MSYAWGLIWKGKDTSLIGSIVWGLAITLLIEVPIILLLGYYEEEISIWVWIVFFIIVFPIATFSLYKSRYKKSKK